MTAAVVKAYARLSSLENSRNEYVKSDRLFCNIRL